MKITVAPNGIIVDNCIFFAQLNHETLQEIGKILAKSSTKTFVIDDKTAKAGGNLIFKFDGVVETT